MGLRTSYAPGTFCWADLATSDAEGATAFYRVLLGWEAHPMPAGDGLIYTMLNVGDEPVAALYEMTPEQAAGQPPGWTSYVAVADAEAAAARASEFGATVLMPAFDVLDAGRMALIADPQGAVLALWQARRHIGAGRVNDPGAICLNQLNTTDPPAAATFYAATFGWSITQVATEPQAYWGIENAGGLNGGMMALPPGALAPPHWLVYFTTPELDASANAITDGGGAVVVPPMTVPAGRILVAQDPQGAYFALFEGDVDP